MHNQTIRESTSRLILLPHSVLHQRKCITLTKYSSTLKKHAESTLKYFDEKVLNEEKEEFGLLRDVISLQSKRSSADNFILPEDAANRLLEVVIQRMESPQTSKSL